MRVNVYSQEISSDWELVQQRSNTGVVYSAIRLFLVQRMGDAMRLAVLLTLALVAGCDQRPRTEPDQCLRAQLFQRCLSIVPTGPQSVHENGDWAEVVGECEDAAYYQSKRAPESIATECRSSS